MLAEIFGSVIWGFYRKQPMMGLSKGETNLLLPRLYKWLTEQDRRATSKAIRVRSSVSFRITSNQTDSDTKSDWGQH